MPTIAVPTGSLSFDGHGATGRGWGVGLELIGQQVTVDVGVTISIPTGSLQINSDACSAEITHTRFMPAATSLLFTETTPDPLVNHIRGPPVGSLAFAANAAVVNITHNRSVGLASLSISSDAPSAFIQMAEGPGTRALSFSSDAVTTNITHIRQMSVGSLSLTGIQPESAGIGRRSLPGLGSLSFSPDSITISVDYVGGSPGDGTLILNPDATTDNPNNYEQCDFSGFRVLPGSLKYTWNNYGVRKKSWEERHPSDFQKNPTSERKKGSRRPEQEDRFLDDNEITVDDL